MVDRVVGSRQVHEDSTGDQALLIAIFDVLRHVQSVAGSYTIFLDEIRLVLEYVSPPRVLLSGSV